jgi:hypothetical protein
VMFHKQLWWQVSLLNKNELFSHLNYIKKSKKYTINKILSLYFVTYCEYCEYCVLSILVRRLSSHTWTEEIVSLMCLSWMHYILNLVLIYN